MSRFSLYKKLSLVGILVVNCLSSGSVRAAPDDDDYEGRAAVENKKEENRVKERDQDKAEKHRDQCREDIEKIKKATSKFIGACRNAGIGSTALECSNTLDECKDNAGLEGLLDPTTVISAALGVPNPNGGGGSSCSDYSYTDYKSELKDLKRDKKDVEKELKDLEKDRIDIEKDYSEDKKKANDAMIEEQEKRNEDELKASEDERKVQFEKQQNDIEIRKKMRDLHRMILKAQNEKAAKTIARGAEVRSNQLDLLSCQRQAEEFATKGAPSGAAASNLTTQAQTKRVAGSLSSVGANKGNKKKIMAAVMKTCIDRIVSDRNVKAEAYRLEMAQLDNEIKMANEEMQEQQQTMQLIAQQSAQMAQDRSIKKQQAAIIAQQKQAQRLKEMYELDEQMKASRQRIDNSINETRSAITQASNELGNHEKEKPKTKSSKPHKEDMREAVAEITTLDCSRCEGDDSNLKALRAECNRNLSSASGSSNSSSGSKGSSTPGATK